MTPNGSASGIWESICEGGLEMYESRSEQVRTSTLILIGTSGSGKSTLINSLLERDEEVKPSLPVEYTYARRTNKHMLKDVCYMWEVGETSSISFIDDLIKSESLQTVSVVVVIDLSKVKDLWNVCDSISSFHETRRRELKVRANYGIVCTKYDIYERELNTEQKMVICRILKHYASVIGSPLVFCTKEDRSTMKVAKDLLSHLAFNTKFSHQIKFDMNSPIIMPKGGENKSEMSYLLQNFEANFGKVDQKPSKTMPLEHEEPYYANEAIDNRKKGDFQKVQKDTSITDRF